MQELVIQPAQQGKGRSFVATLLAYVVADSLWPEGQTATEVVRPVWMMLGGTDNELRPFVANLRTGRKAEFLKSGYYRKCDKLEILKSSKFSVGWQRTPSGTTVTLFEPDLFRLDPGMVDPKGVEFCILPDSKWLADMYVPPPAREYAEAIGVPEERREHLLRLAPLFIAYLDRRTRCPLIPDHRFYVQVLSSALVQGLASLSSEDPTAYYRQEGWGVHRRLRFSEFDTSAVGLSPGVALCSSHEVLETFLAEEVKTYFERTGK